MKKSLYDLLDLERPDKNVKKAVERGTSPPPTRELLKYFRTRKPVQALRARPRKHQRSANSNSARPMRPLEHKFYAHKGYQPLLLLRRRHQLAILARQRTTNSAGSCTATTGSSLLAKCYYLTRDNRYIDAWIDQYTDWVKKKSAGRRRASQGRRSPPKPKSPPNAKTSASPGGPWRPDAGCRTC